MAGEVPNLRVDAQEGLIGCCLLGAAGDVIDAGCTSDWMVDPKCKMVFEAIEALVSSNATVSLATVHSKLKSVDLLWLGGLEEKAPIANNWRYWFDIVSDAALRYSLWAMSNQAAEWCMGDKNSDDILGNLEMSISRLQQGQRSLEDSWGTGIAQLCDALADAGSNEATGLSTGHDGLDQVYGGIKPSTMNTIAGRPGAGKSALAANIALSVAKEGKKVLVFTAEMSAKEYQQRLLAHMAQVDIQYYLKNPTLGDGRKLATYLAQLKDFPIQVMDDPNITVRQMRSYSRKVAKKGLGLIVVDYLQLYRPGVKCYNREAEVREASRLIKLMAMETEAPVLSLCQMNRSIEGRGEDARPRLADLRESGSIEQDSDTVGFIHMKNSGADGEVTFYLAKNRNGAQGAAKLEFQRWSSSFL